jgi:MGT family glycosyltransferase
MMKALVFNIPAHGHVNPTIPLIQELIGRSVTVVNYNAPSFQLHPELKAIFSPCPILEQIDTKQLTQQISAIQLVDIISGMVDELTEFTISRIEKEKPDFIIHDSFALWGKTAAFVTKVPAASSLTTFAFNSKVFWSAPGFAWETIVTSCRHIKHLLKINRRLNSYYLKYGMKADSVFDYMVNREKVNLIYTSRYFQPCSQSFGPEFKFVGPSFQFDRPPEKQKLIYISLGTIYNRDPKFFQMCFEALGDLPYQVILSLGKGLSVSFSDAIPKNFEVYEFVDQVQVLQKAALFITHSGMNSTNEGLSANTPLIMIPQINEQRLVAKRVQDLGAGIALNRKNLNARMIRETVLQVLNERSYLENTAKIRESFIESGGVKRAASEVLSLVS